MEDNLATRSNPLGQADQHYHPGEEEPEGEIHPDFKALEEYLYFEQLNTYIP